MTTLFQVVYREAAGLPDEALAEVLAHILRLLAARGAATAEQLRTLEQLDPQRTQMDTAIQMFKFENKQEIRVVEGEDGEPWFVAVDIAKALGYSNPQDAIRTHCKGVSETLIPSVGGIQRGMIIAERDVYRLIMRSKLPQAERFEEWVVGEVLPSVRKAGSYSIKPMTTGEMLVAQAQAMLEYERRLTAVEGFMHAQQVEQKRLPAYVEMPSEERYTIVAYANILGINISRQTATEYGKRASAWSREHGYQIDQVSDPRFGRVNIYCVEALEYAFEDGSHQ
jgi:prophage antirepressor-like protein